MEVKTRDQARQYFKDKGLTYGSITLNDLHYLKELLNRQFVLDRVTRLFDDDFSLYWVRVNDAKYYKGKFDDFNRLICAYLTGKGDYFTAREVISFNPSGYIGFCGDSSDRNTAPVITAFVEWCDWLTTR